MAYQPTMEVTLLTIQEMLDSGAFYWVDGETIDHKDADTVFTKNLHNLAGTTIDVDDLLVYKPIDFLPQTYNLDAWMFDIKSRVKYKLI